MSPSDETFDVVIIGGGITGVFLALESAERGLRPLLLERNGFGAATSANSLRIIHGGMRYLQSLDLGRFRESVRDQVWLLRNFPGLVQPVKCIMPLYGDGPRRPGVFRTALRINCSLRGAVLDGPDPLERGTVLDAAATASAVPALPRHGLRGGGVWFDARMGSGQLLDHVLQRAVAAGVVALDDVDATGLRLADGRVTGIETRAADGSERSFAAPVVVNAAGPWADELTRRFTSRGLPGFALTLAFNLVIDRRPVSDLAVAVRDPVVRQNFFLLPLEDRTVAGTWYEPWPATGDHSAVANAAESAAGAMLDALNRAVPALALTTADIAAVQPGLLPAQSAGSAVPADRAAFHDHSRLGGPAGLFSVVGIKYTTARALARRALRSISPLSV
jgi:glycerol-3-phosphate dehydrogenase